MRASNSRTMSNIRSPSQSPQHLYNLRRLLRAYQEKTINERFDMHNKVIDTNPPSGPNWRELDSAERIIERTIAYREFLFHDYSRYLPKKNKGYQIEIARIWYYQSVHFDERVHESWIYLWEYVVGEMIFDVLKAPLSSPKQVCQATRDFRKDSLRKAVLRHKHQEQERRIRHGGPEPFIPQPFTLSKCHLSSVPAHTFKRSLRYFCKNPSPLRKVLRSGMDDSSQPGQEDGLTAQDSKKRKRSCSETDIDR